MPCSLPQTRDELLATAKMSPEFAAAWEKMPLPSGADYGDIGTLKALNEAGLPNIQKRLAATRPPTITETEVYLATRDNWQSRTIICHPTTPNPSQPSPLIVIFFGGGHCIGHPESELPLARSLALAHNAVIALPSYRLAPTHPYPTSFHDAWDILQSLATSTTISHSSSSTKSSPLPPFTTPLTGFIICGTSAGATLSATLAHLARDHALTPPLTGQALFAGSVTAPSVIPSIYKADYLSRTQPECMNAPLLDTHFHTMLREAHQAVLGDRLATPFDWREVRGGGGGDGDANGIGNPNANANVNANANANGRVGEGHKGLCAAYFQVCGMDITRDDGLVYERVLREESGVQTRLDLYEGWPHCWWGVYPDLEMSRRRERDAVDGVGWLLGLSKSGK